MERATFFDHYRIGNEYDGSPSELGRFGPAVTYKASDLRTGAPVALTLLPIASVDPAARDPFEEQARSAQKLDHVNIAKTYEFGVLDDQFAFVTEYPQGETVEQWIAAHGPMPADAVLRVGLQVVSALAAAGFVGLSHSAIQPSNLMIVPGRTAEGGWPCVKLMDFALAGLQLPPGQREEEIASEFASPEQLARGTADFRSEIYSLGATMCFLLTGAFYSAEPRSLQTRRFARPLRKLITPMLRQNPDERPQDPVLFAQALRSCLQEVERRQAIARTLGLSFTATKPVRSRRQPIRPPVSLVERDFVGAPPVSTVSIASELSARSRLWPRMLAIAAILLALLTAAALLLPAPVSMILRRNRDKQAIGVPVGIPDSAAVSMAQKRSVATAAPAVSTPLQLPVHNGPSSAPGSSSNKVVADTNGTISPPPTRALPAPASSPAVVGPSETAVVGAGETVAQTSPPASETSVPPQTAPTVTEQSQSRVAEASAPAGPRPDGGGNNRAQPPTAPAEGPQTVWEREAGVKPKTIAKNSGDEAETSSTSDAKQTTKKTANRPNATTSRSRSNSNDVASNTSRTRTPRYDRSRTSQIPFDGEDQYQTPYQPYEQDPPHRVRRALPVPDGSFRARVVGTTPDGGLVLRLPSGEIAIVPPRHYPRRVWIERQPYFEPRPRPDFVPPDDFD
jgi:serine/threonine protein kinase